MSRVGKWNRADNNEQIRDKHIGTLLFSFDNYKINKLWECINDKYTIFPKDLTINRMGENIPAHEEIYFLMSSKKYFATGYDGKKCPKGYVEFDHKKKEIRFKKREDFSDER